MTNPEPANLTDARHAALLSRLLTSVEAIIDRYSDEPRRQSHAFELKAAIERSIELLELVGNSRAAVEKAKAAMYEDWLRQNVPSCPLLAENIADAV